MIDINQIQIAFFRKNAPFILTASMSFIKLFDGSGNLDDRQLRPQRLSQEVRVIGGLRPGVHGHLDLPEDPGPADPGHRQE